MPTPRSRCRWARSTPRRSGSSTSPATRSTSAIAATLAGNRLGDIGAAAEHEARDAGFGVVREYVGHGIGTAMHEDPDVPNYGPPGRGMKLRAGIVLAIEPMVTAGKATTRMLDDGWTVVTADGSRAAHFEHTVAITDDGPTCSRFPELQPFTGPYVSTTNGVAGASRPVRGDLDGRRPPSSSTGPWTQPSEFTAREPRAPLRAGLGSRRPDQVISSVGSLPVPRAQGSSRISS